MENDKRKKNGYTDPTVDILPAAVFRHSPERVRVEESPENSALRLFHRSAGIACFFSVRLRVIPLDHPLSPFAGRGVRTGVRGVRHSFPCPWTARILRDHRLRNAAPPRARTTGPTRATRPRHPRRPKPAPENESGKKDHHHRQKNNGVHKIIRLRSIHASLAFR